VYFNAYTRRLLEGQLDFMKKNASRDKYELGMRTRIAVVGKRAAEATAAKGEIFKPVHEFLTETVWASVWARPALAWKTRLLINIGILASINRPRELRRYMRAALLHGCTKKEIVEVLLQVGAYCGAPALVEATLAAREVFAEKS
jgi:4-carboxymuconolactone decarboxylase